MKVNDAKRKLIAWAKDQLGYKPSYGKINKYAEYLDNVSNFYNTPKNGADWCDIFVDCGFVQCFGIETGRKMLYQPLKSTGAGCYFSAGFYKAKGQFFYTPEIGDQIFYGPDGGDHTGLVVGVTKSYVTTIEGNWNNQVCQRKLSRTDSRIEGYGRPNWDLVSGQEAPNEEQKEDVKEEIIRYKVQAGDTLGKIADMYGVDVNDIVKWNAIPNKNLIYPGEVFEIHTGKTVEEETPAITVGSKVKLNYGAKTWYGGDLAPFMYSRVYTLSELTGDYAVITFNGVVMAGVHVTDLTLV